MESGVRMQQLVLNEIPKQAPKPPLKWAGGKRWLVPFLRPIWNTYSRRRLVEPMSGGLAVTLSRAVKRYQSSRNQLLSLAQERTKY